MDARGKFEEHERVARGVGESNSSFLSALQTFQVHPSVSDPDLEIRGEGVLQSSRPLEKGGSGLQKTFFHNSVYVQLAKSMTRP